MKFAARGEHSAAEIANLCGIARGHFFQWMKLVRKGGLKALRERRKPGPKKGTCRGLEPKVARQLGAKLQVGDFVTAVEAQRWLKNEHGLERPYHTVWRWLKKAGGVILVPRPSHSKKDPAAAEEFRQGLAERLEALGLSPGSRVEMWMSDEARLGLHTENRRLWACKGQRPVVSRQVKYEWDYLYGSLNVLNGEAHFCQIPSVSLEWDQIYLQDLAASDESVIHVVIRDQAGFHLRDGDTRLPARVRIIDLRLTTLNSTPASNFGILSRMRLETPSSPPSANFAQPCGLLYSAIGSILKRFSLWSVEPGWPHKQTLRR